MIVKRIVQECRAHPVKISSCEPGRFIDCLTAGTPNPKGSQMFARDLKPGLVILTGWLVGTGSSIAQTNFAAQANGGGRHLSGLVADHLHSQENTLDSAIVRAR